MLGSGDVAEEAAKARRCSSDGTRSWCSKQAPLSPVWMAVGLTEWYCLVALDDFMLASR